jgi:hypothetical protein
MLEMMSLPFHVKTPLGKAFGLARLESQALVIEYQWCDRFTGMFRSRIRTVHIPYMALQNVGLQTRWHGKTSLVLQAQSLMTFRHIPAAAQGFCWLQIQRRDREQATHFIDYLQIRLSERQLEHLYRPEFLEEATNPGLTKEAQLLQPWSQKLAQLLSKM